MSVSLEKQRISVSEPPFGGRRLSGDVCDSSLARCKARSRRPIGYKFIIEHFCLGITAKALTRRRWLVLKGDDQFAAKY